MSEKLTDKQRVFVTEYVASLNATQAAIKAGYSEKTAGVIGCENLAKPNIQAAIEKMHRENAEKCLVTVESLTDELNESINMAREQQDPNAMRAAVMSKAKIHGLEVHKSEVSGETIHKIQRVIIDN